MIKAKKKQQSYRDKIIDCAAKIVQQWIDMGDFKIGGYQITRGEVVERLQLSSFEKLTASPQELYNFDETVPPDVGRNNP